MSREIALNTKRQVATKLTTCSGNNLRTSFGSSCQICQTLSGQTVNADMSSAPKALNRTDHNLCALRQWSIGVGNFDGIFDNDLDND
jgi:hypothetical protein